MHITAWVLAFILLFIVATFYKQGKMKPGKILHMILRLVYLLILLTGVLLFLEYSNWSGELIVKVIAGIWAIAAMEMITVKASKEKSTKSAWIQFVIVAFIAIILGFGRLSLGIHLF